MKPFYERDGIELFHADAVEFLPTLAAGAVDACVTDPPYGIGVRHGHVTTDNSHCKWNTRHHNTPIAGDEKPFDPSPLLSLRLPLICWGANFYSDKLPGAGWLIWDKRPGIEDMAFNRSDSEVAYFSESKTVKTFRHLWHGLCRASEVGEHLHPTQKPVQLMAWCIEQIPNATTILDPFAGSGTTLVAAWRLGRRTIGCEIHEPYAELAAKRIDREVSQGRLFPPEPAEPLEQLEF